MIASGRVQVQLLSRINFEAVRQKHPELNMQLKAAIEEMDYKALSPFATEVRTRARWMLEDG